MEFDVAIEINASRERVWSLLSDVEQWPLWNSSVSSVVKLTNGPLRVGSRVSINQPKLGTAQWTVTELDEGNSFVWRCIRPGVTLSAGHYVSDADSGSVNLRLTVMQSGLLARLVAPLTNKMAVQYVHLEARGLKQRAEATD